MEFELFAGCAPIDPPVFGALMLPAEFAFAFAGFAFLCFFIAPVDI